MARPSTRETLLDCAEALFAEHGLEGVSLRAINVAAKLSPAALHYHFGTKHALVEALLDRHMPTLMERRRALLDGVEKTHGAPTSRAVMNALAQPLVELLAAHSEAGHRYLRLIYRLQADGDLFPHFSAEKYSAGVDRLVPMLCRALPQLPIEIVEFRLGLAIDVMLRSLALGPVHAGNDLESHMNRLLDFLTGAFEASDTRAGS
jgi:AcrR family transcriptional regulator